MSIVTDGIEHHQLIVPLIFFVLDNFFKPVFYGEILKPAFSVADIVFEHYRSSYLIILHNIKDQPFDMRIIMYCFSLFFCNSTYQEMVRG